MSVEELCVVEMAWVLANRHPLQPAFKWEEAESLGGALMANTGGHLQSLLSSSSLHPSVEARLARALPQHHLYASGSQMGASQPDGNSCSPLMEVGTSS